MHLKIKCPVLPKFIHQITKPKFNSFSSLLIARMFTGCEHNIPLRHRAMFIVSMPFGMGGLLNLGKSFLGPVKKRIHVLPNDAELLRASKELLNDPDVIPSEIMG